MGVIPDEAVEAAARAIFGDPSGETWALQLPEVQARTREDARLALEAAAPHLMAAAQADALEKAATAIESDEDPRDRLTIEWLRARAAKLKETSG